MTKFTRFDTQEKIGYAHSASNELNGDYYFLHEAFTYFLYENSLDSWVRVPEGFLTDGATVPRAFWGFVPPTGKHGQAAILHDYLCEYLTISVNGVDTKISRKDADVIFKEALILLGVSKFKASLMYSAVSLYRVLFRVTEPTTDLVKQAMEVEIRSIMDATSSVKLDSIIRVDSR